MVENTELETQLTSEEAIVDTLDVNEFLFTKEGKSI